MRVIWNEMKKIWNWKWILSFTICTVFLYIYIVPFSFYSNECSEITDDILARKLINDYQFGPTIEGNEWNRLEKLRIEQEKKCDQFFLQEYPKFSEKYQISSFKQLREELSKSYEKDKLTSKEKERFDVMEKLENEMVFEKHKSECFLLQLIEQIFKKQNRESSCSSKETSQLLWGKNVKFELEGQTFVDTTFAQEVKGQKLEEKIPSSLSLLPLSVLSYFKYAFFHFMVFLLLGEFILLLPYFIRERSCNVTPLSLTTITGRNLFKTQTIASILSAVSLAVIQIGIFLLVLYNTHMLEYIDCPFTTSCSLKIFGFDLRFGIYLLLMLVLGFFFCTGMAMIAVVISRYAPNYIIGIGFAIPFAVAGIYIVKKMVHDSNVQDMLENIMTYEQICLILGITILSILTLIVTTKREEKLGYQS